MKNQTPDNFYEVGDLSLPCSAWECHTGGSASHNYAVRQQPTVMHPLAEPLNEEGELWLQRQHPQKLEQYYPSLPCSAWECHTEGSAFHNYIEAVRQQPTVMHPLTEPLNEEGELWLQRQHPQKLEQYYQTSAGKHLKLCWRKWVRSEKTDLLTTTEY